MKFELNDHEMFLLNKGIAGMKYKDAAPLVATINRQIQEQQEKQNQEKNSLSGSES